MLQKFFLKDFHIFYKKPAIVIKMDNKIKLKIVCRALGGFSDNIYPEKHDEAKINVWN